MKKYAIVALAALTSFISTAQDDEPTGSFSGGFESNTQWYRSDRGLTAESEDGVIAPQDPLRSNDYFSLSYNYGAFTAGIQYEMYAPSPLLGYDPAFQGNGVGTYFLNFRKNGLDITGGYFYEQFGSGLVLRFWEDRQIGINNALQGVRVKYDFTNYFSMTGLMGNQRVAFEKSDGTISAVNTEVDISRAFNLDTGITFGASYVGRYNEVTIDDPEGRFPSTVNAYSLRSDFIFTSFNIGGEFVYKDPDATLLSGRPRVGNYYSGKAVLINAGYATKGLGVNATFRTMENMDFYSDRTARGNAFLQQTINFIPAYTKQQDYTTTNIYVYQSQGGLKIGDETAGEIGGQVDIFYSAPRDTFIGGKYGTKFTLNYSNWSGLEGTYDDVENFYEAELFSKGEKYFEEVSVEMKKKWSKRFSSIFTYVHTEYNGDVILGKQFFVKANIAVIDGLYRLNNGKSIRMDVQHLWATADKGNWTAATLEYSFSPALSFYVTDLWNYDTVLGSDVHYYSVGGSYTKGRTRVAMNYGRQRGGLICVGGVCRFVPENNGLTLNISTNF